MTMATRKRLLTILGISSLSCLMALGQRDSGSQSGDGVKEVLNSCQATARRTEMDGKHVTLSGRFYLGSSSSADAPVLLRDTSSCEVDGADGAVLIDASHPRPSPASKRLAELRNDLEPTPCKPRTICLPDRLPRHVYADLVVTGRFHVVEKEQRVWAYCCSLEVEDIVSVEVGPERPKSQK
jgi:hypothetical protein